MVAYVTQLSPNNDAAVFQDLPNSNYGGENWLEVASKIDSNRRSYLKFDLSQLSENALPLDADLNLYFYWGSGFTTLRDAGVLIEARAILDDSWSESTVMWNNAPALGDLLNAVEIGSYGWKVWSVGDFVAQQSQNDKLASFAIKFSVESYDSTLRRIRFYSEEYADNLDQRSYLKVEYFPSG
ncbi:MAG: DNRLRE domain-containing protein [Candidatus Hodarchaeaceae archaeon]|nr:DNRLRE domain-containing protein [Candidatus Hodarchaeaceae archaeon]